MGRAEHISVADGANGQCIWVALTPYDDIGLGGQYIRWQRLRYIRIPCYEPTICRGGRYRSLALDVSELRCLHWGPTSNSLPVAYIPGFTQRRRVFLWNLCGILARPFGSTISVHAIRLLNPRSFLHRMQFMAHSVHSFRNKHAPSMKSTGPG